MLPVNTDTRILSQEQIIRNGQEYERKQSADDDSVQIDAGNRKQNVFR